MKNYTTGLSAKCELCDQILALRYDRKILRMPSWLWVVLGKRIEAISAQTAHLRLFANRLRVHRELCQARESIAHILAVPAELLTGSGTDSAAHARRKSNISESAKNGLNQCGEFFYKGGS